MPPKPEPLSQTEEQFVDALLNEAYRRNPEEESARVSALMREVRQSESSSEPVLPSGQTISNVHGRTWVKLAVAACLLITIGYAATFVSESNTAYAAVWRAIHADLPPREYRIAMVNRWPVLGERNVVAKLYINKQKQFCIHHPGMLTSGEIWVGGDLDNRWIVPEKGPILTGDRELIASSLQPSGLAHPMLHLDTLLLRMSREYKLEIRGSERIPHSNAPNTTVSCQRVSGVREADDSLLPSRIELWANTETGAAERVELTWPEDGDSWLPLRWTIELVSYPDLPEDWFRFQGHSDANQEVMPFHREGALPGSEGSST